MIPNVFSQNLGIFDYSMYTKFILRGGFFTKLATLAQCAAWRGVRAGGLGREGQAS